MRALVSQKCKGGVKLQQFSLFENCNLVIVDDRLQAVCNAQQGAVGKLGAHGLLNKLVGFWVNIRLGKTE